VDTKWNERRILSIEKGRQMKRIIIIGSRRRNSNKDFEKVKRWFFSIYKNGDKIVSGGCKKGGDKFAENLANTYGIPKKIFKPDYEKYGCPAALFIRNTKVAKFGSIMIACVAPDRTGGTEDTIKKFKKFHPKGKIHLC